MTKCKDCNKGASFNYPDELAIYCATHKKDGMINVYKKFCNETDCEKYAINGYFKCSKHGGGKRCNEPGCGAGAVGKTDKCGKHGGGKRCNEPDCKSLAQGKTDKCSKHGGVKRCNEPGCESGVQGNTDKCSNHKGGKRCNEPGCESGAVDKTGKCITHGGGKRCNEPGCGEGAVGKTDKCSKHGGGKRCPNCIDWIDSRCGWNKYDGYCATCFKQVFPEDERSKVVYTHTKEIRVRNAINDKFRGFIHDRPLYTGDCDCTHRRRIDHRKLIGNTILAIETDEFGHRDYDEKDEIIRYDDLYMIHSGKWIFIRFNPDGDKKIDMEDKLEKLIDTIEEQVERIENEENEKLLEIIKLC